MEYIYAAMLLHKAGKKIDEDGVKRVLEAASVAVDTTRVKALVAALDGVDIDKAIKETVVAAAPAAPAAEAKAEKKKEEKHDKEDEKKSEEQAAAGLGALFG
jgi:large subunit ribosomal protein L12